MRRGPAVVRTLAGAALCVAVAACGPTAEVALDSPFDPANAHLDFDGDGLTNGEERALGTDRRVADSDGDGLSDSEDPCPTGPDSCPDEFGGGVSGEGDGDGGQGGEGGELGEDPGEAGGGDEGGEGDGGVAGDAGDAGGDDGQADGSVSADGGEGGAGDGFGDGGGDLGVGDDGGDDGGEGGEEGSGDDGGDDSGEECVPALEVCNGVDDDCDGQLDPGCNGCEDGEQVDDGWVCIPGTGVGNTELGSPEEEEGRGEDERSRLVRLTRSYLMQITEVTREDWADRMLPREFSDAGARANLPVDGVSWYDALTYANALSRQEGLAPCYELSGCRVEQGGVLDCSEWDWADGPDCEGYRLPTEAEWEHAAKAMSELALEAVAEQAWCGSETEDPEAGPAGPDVVQPVRGREPNEFGLYDMLGNAAEWVFDAYVRHPAPTSTDPYERGGPNDLRVLRGGAVGNEWADCRPAARESNEPDNPAPARGFRLVRTAN